MDNAEPNINSGGSEYIRECRAGFMERYTKDTKTYRECTESTLAARISPTFMKQTFTVPSETMNPEHKTNIRSSADM